MITPATPPTDSLLRRFSAHVSGQIGLCVPHEQWPEVLSLIDAQADECGPLDLQACVERCLAAPLQRAQVEALARRLVVGETYFFREPAAFEALEQHVLMPLIAKRRAAGQRALRIWSAGCSSGEEVYTLAILLQRLLPDDEDWDVTLFGTDIHPDLLEHARCGIYRDWSFRGVPAWVRQRHFEALEDGRQAIRPELRRWTTFGYFNLAADSHPDLPEAMDLVLCRHVLMYFDAAKAAEVVQRLHRALLPQGWLLVSAVEVGARLYAGFDALSFHGAVLYRKQADPAPPPRPAPVALAQPVPPPPSAGDSDAPAARARSHADQGRHGEALYWCQAALALDKCNADLHYLHALIEEERARHEEAEAALLRVLFLDPDFIPAHFALARLAERQGQADRGARHREQALRLLALRSAATRPGEAIVIKPRHK